MRKKFNRRSIRLREYDYSRPGYYFVTVCVRNRECLFGEIIDGEMHLNEYGEIVNDVWNYLPNRYPAAKLDIYGIMPDHFHGIITVGAIHELPLQRELRSPWQRRKMVLPKIIGYFKMNTAKHINQIR
jgi:putative transposase